MKIKCLHNSGNELLGYPRIPRLTSIYTQYGELEIGKEYLVMGMILFEDHFAYLIDDGIVSACPYQLFEIIDNKVPSNWYFNNFTSEDSAYPFVEAVWGFYELCFERNYYEKLIVEKEEEATMVYFRRKIELENELLDTYSHDCSLKKSD